MPKSSATRPSLRTPRPSTRRAISLIEILISMFVLLFGLMGVAAIFPVGNHYVTQGENFDLGAGVAQNAFEELSARGMLRPDKWLYAGVPAGADINNLLFIQDNTAPDPDDIGFFNVRLPGPITDPHPGHAFVIDPLGRAAGSDAGGIELRGFPLWDSINDSDTESQGMPSTWSTAMDSAGVVPGGTWPVRRITLPVPAGPMTRPIAETIFRLRDDLAVEQPDENDRPSIQRWDVDSTTTPQSLLRRQYKGDYSWLATVVPTTGEALKALQPGYPTSGEVRYDVSVVVFRKRDETPSAESERTIEAELLQGGELVIYATGTGATEVVDQALEDVRAGQWIALMGVNQTTGDFLMKWYRLLTLDTKDETGPVVLPSGVNNAFGRRAMLVGPDWPSNSITNLRACILPAAISVVTKQLKMEESSLWSLE